MMAFSFDLHSLVRETEPILWCGMTVDLKGLSRTSNLESGKRGSSKTDFIPI